MTVLEAALVRDDAALFELEAEWAALWDRCPDATPFQHPAWLLPWWRVFGTGRSRMALLRGPSGDLLGVLPLYELRAEMKVLPIGAGLTDYQDSLVAPDGPADAASRLLAVALAGCALPCHLTDLPPHARLRHARPPRGWSAAQHDSDPCPVLLPEAVPARQRRKLRMARHRADRAGGYRIEAAAFESLVALHAATWRERGQPGVLADASVRAFHEIAIPALRRAGLLRLRALRLGPDIAAVIHALQDRRALYFYLSGFDPAHAFVSPGTILLGAMLEEARAEGLEAHFLRGAEPYKYAWGAADRRNVTRILTPPA